MPETGFDIDPATILDAGDEIPENVDETPEDETTADETTADETTADETPADDETPEDEEGAEKPAKGKTDEEGYDDPKKVTKELQNALSKFRDADPANKPLAKALRNALGHDQAYQESFKTPQEAREFKAAVEAVGGREGIVQLQEHATRYQEQEAASEAGDPELVTRYAKDFPDGFKKAAPFVLDELRKLDHAAYAKALQPHLVDSLEAIKIPAILDNLVAQLAKGDAESLSVAKQIASNLKQWVDGEKNDAKQFRSSAANPDKGKLDDAWKEVNTEKDKIFFKEVDSSVGSYTGPKLYKAGEPYIRGVALGQQRAFFSDVVKEIKKQMGSDTTYTTQEKAIIKSKNRDGNKLVAFRNAKFDQVYQAAIEKTAKDYGYKAGAKPVAGAKPGVKQGGTKPPVTGAGSNANNPVYISAAPKVEDRDIEKMGGKDKALDFQIRGKSLMKTGPYKGKWVAWRGNPAK